MPSKPDIWMPLYIGDYLAATAHLDAQESGAYLHLLMHQWKNGKLPADLEGLRRIAKVEKDAWSNAWALLTPFFDCAQGYPIQLHLEDVREEWKSKQLKAQSKAKSAADARWHKDAPSNTQAMPNLCPSSSSSPIPIKEPLNTPLSPTIFTEVKTRPEEFANTWNKLRGPLPKVERFTDSRKKKVATRIHQGVTLECFEKAILCCVDKPFLRGENKDGWTATFDWLVENDINIEKAMNNYESNGGKTNGKIDRAYQTANDLIQEIEDNNGHHAGELLPWSGTN